MTHSALPAIAVLALVINSATTVGSSPFFLSTPSVQDTPTCADWGTKEFMRAYERSAEPWRECIRGGADPNVPLSWLSNSPLLGVIALFVLNEDVGPELAKVFSALIEAGADVNAEISVKGFRAPLLFFTVIWTGESPRAMDMTETLLAAGAHRKFESLGGANVLHAAAMGASPAVIPMLVNAGADIHARTEEGGTPLHLAAKSGDNPEMIRALLAAGADLHAPGESGETPLHTAAGHNENREVIDALVAAGADINARSSLGTTPLHWATSFARTTTGLEALLAAGADPNVLDRLNNLPIDYAAENRAIRGTGAYFRLIQARLR